jgi:hypothetical protein
VIDIDRLCLPVIDLFQIVGEDVDGFVNFVEFWPNGVIEIFRDRMRGVNGSPRSE